MLIGINPLVDYVCKKLFGDPMHSAITLHFINAILRSVPQITKFEILNPIMDKDYDAAAQVTVTLICVHRSGFAFWTRSCSPRLAIF